MEERKLTICFFGEAKPEDIHTVKWAKYFSDKGHNVHLFSYSDFGNNRVKKIKLHLLKKKFPISVWPFNSLVNLPLTLINVKKLIKKINPDIVHAHCVTSYGTLASLIGFHPFVLTSWGSDILVNPKNNLATKKATQYALKKVDLITCDAEHMKTEMVKLGAEPSKIHIIYFGVDTKKFSLGKKDNNLIKEWGFKVDDKIVISLRGLESLYDVETLIKTVPIVLRNNPQVKFIVTGEGSQKEKLKKLAENLKIEKSVKFVGWISPEDLPDYLRTADIYVSTSLSDGGIASSTAEAMACGLPVVITDTGDNKKWIKNGENGFVIPTRTPEILAEKIIYLLKNIGSRKNFGEANRKLIEEKNNYYKEMEKMEEIYKELVKR